MMVRCSQTKPFYKVTIVAGRNYYLLSSGGGGGVGGGVVLIGWHCAKVQGHPELERYKRVLIGWHCDKVQG